MNSSCSTSSAIDSRAIKAYITLLDDYLNDFNKLNTIVSNEQYRLFDHLTRKLQQLSFKLRKSKKENGAMPNNNTSPESKPSSSTKTENSDNALNEKLDKRTVEVSENHQDVQQEPPRRLTQFEKYAKYPIKIQNFVKRVISDNENDMNDFTEEVTSNTNIYENETYAEEAKYSSSTKTENSDNALNEKLDKRTVEVSKNHQYVQQEHSRRQTQFEKSAKNPFKMQNTVKRVIYDDNNVDDSTEEVTSNTNTYENETYAEEAKYSSSTKTENSDNALNGKLDKRTVEVSKNRQYVQQEPSKGQTQFETYAKNPFKMQNTVKRVIYDDNNVDDSTEEVTSNTNTYENEMYAEEGIIYVNKYYKCTLCKVDRLTKDDVMSHRVIQQHRINVKNVNMEELVKFMTNLPQVLKEDEDDMLYIVKGIESEFRCRVCQCELPTMHHVNDHLISDGHKKTIDC